MAKKHSSTNGAALSAIDTNVTLAPVVVAPYVPVVIEDNPNINGEVLKKAVVLCIKVTMPGVKKKVKPADIHTDKDFDRPEDDMLHISKKLFDSTELQRVRRAAKNMRNFIREYALPSNFQAGMYALPLGVVDKVDRELESFCGQPSEYEEGKTFWGFVNAFIAAYPDRVTEAKEKLGALYNPAEYPSAATMRAAFGIEIRYLDFGVPGTLKEISNNIWRREQEKAAEVWQKEAEHIKDALREGMSEYVEHIVECLGKKEDGKPMMIRDSTITNMLSFLETLPAKNEVIGDTALARLADEAANLLKGVKPAELRKNEGERDRIRAGFQALQGILTDNMHVAPRRQLRLQPKAAAETAVVEAEPSTPAPTPVKAVKGKGKGGKKEKPATQESESLAA